MKVLSLCLLVLLWTGILASDFENLLNTNQYLLVGVSGCSITLEAALPIGSCPRHYSNDVGNANRCSWTNIITLTDPSEKSSTVPKLLAVGEIDGLTVALVKTLEFPLQTADNRRIRTVSMLENTTELTVLSRLKPLNVLYDSDSKLLYVLSKEASVDFKVHAFTIDFNDGNNVKLKWLYNVSISSKFAETHWFSDPYSKKFYFYAKNRNNEPIVIQSVPFAGIVPFLTSWEATDDSVNATVAGDRRAISVSNRVLISTQYSLPNVNFLTSFDDDTKQIKCQFLKRRVAESVVIIRDWDFCRIRDGHNADFQTCSAEYETWLERDDKNSQAELTRILFRIAVAVAVLSVVLLIAFVILYKRLLATKSAEIMTDSDSCLKDVVVK